MQGSDTSARWQDSLSVKLLGFVIGIILLVELLIFIPSAVTFRDNWIDDRIQAAGIAALAMEAAPTQRVSEELSDDLLRNAEVLTVAIIGKDRRQLVLAPQVQIGGPMIEIARTGEPYLSRLSHTLSMFSTRTPTILKVTSTNGMDQDSPPEAEPESEPEETTSTLRSQ